MQLQLTRNYEDIPYVWVQGTNRRSTDWAVPLEESTIERRNGEVKYVFHDYPNATCGWTIHNHHTFSGDTERQYAWGVNVNWTVEVTDYATVVEEVNHDRILHPESL